MSSVLEYYAKQSKFLPAKACSWVSRDQRLWENSDKHVPHPFSLGEREWYVSSLQLAPGELPSVLLLFSAPLQSDKAAAQISLAALCWPRSHHHQETRRRRESYLGPVKPLSISPPQWGLGFQSTSSSGSPALTLLPAFMPEKLC